MHFRLSTYESLGDAFRLRFPTFGDQIAMIECDRDQEKLRLSYQEVVKQAERVAALLQNRGFLPGHRCAILMSNQSKWLLSGLGVLWAGGVVVPLDCKVTAREQCAFLRHCQPQVLISERLLWERLRQEQVDLAHQLVVLVTEAEAGADLEPALRWESETSHPFRYQRRTRDDLAAILYSSGTGGSTKGCMLTHGNYLAQVEHFHAHAQFRQSDRYFSVLPTNHAVDFVFGFLYPLLRGCTVVHQRTVRPQYLLSTLKSCRIDVTTFVPLILKEIRKGILQRLETLSPWQMRLLRTLVRLNRWATPGPQYWLSRILFKPVHDEFGGRLRLIMTGGSPVSAPLVRFFYDLGFFVGIGYGLTEAGTTVSAPVWTRFYDDNVGKVLPGTQVEIRRPDAHGVGEIWVRSPSVMKGYLNDPEMTAAVLVDGWLCTDDLGSLDANGFLKIKGRLKNMIVTEGGLNIYPEDIEAAFDDLPSHIELCVFATHYVWPEACVGEEKLFIVVHAKEAIEQHHLLTELQIRNRRLTNHKRICGFIPWSSDFPRVSSLKVKRHELAQQVAVAVKPEHVQVI